MIAPLEPFGMRAVIWEISARILLFIPGRGTVAHRHGLQKFVCRFHADPPYACPQLSETHSGTFLMMQRTILEKNSGEIPGHHPYLG